MSPFALRFQRRAVMLCGFVLDGALGFHEQPVQFFLPRTRLKFVAPEVCRRLVAGIGKERGPVELLAVNIPWQSQPGFHVGAPGIEVHVVFVFKAFPREMNCRSIGPADMHDRKILILDPDPPDKADAPSVRLSPKNSRFYKHERPRYGTNPLSTRV